VTGLAVEAVTVQHRLAGGDLVRALDRVTLSLRSGEIVALMGAGGAGKSTLAAVAAGLLSPDAGAVTPAADRRPAGWSTMVGQRPELGVLGSTVTGDVGWALGASGMTDAEAKPRVDSALARVGLDPAQTGPRSPYALSGGELHRVAIAAAVAPAPRLLVLDEPAVGLDAPARDALHAVTRQAAAEGAAVLLVTHDAEEAAKLATRLVVLEQGRVAFDGVPAGLLANPPAAAALGIEAPAANVLAHAVARSAGVAAPRVLGEPELVQFIREHAANAGLSDAGRMEPRQAQPEGGEPGWLLADLQAGGRPLGARSRIVAFILLVAAAFATPSLAGALLALTAAGVSVFRARPGHVVVIAAVRPFLFALVVLAALQLTFGGSPEVLIYGEQVVRSDLAWLARRFAQLLTVLLASLALTHRADAVELAEGLRWLLHPLHLLRVPVEELALMLGLGLAFVPTLAADVRVVESARVARGVPARRRLLPVGGSSVVPLFVHALRRSRALADALHMRGFVRGAGRSVWHPLPATGLDTVAPAAAALTLFVAYLL